MEREGELMRVDEAGFRATLQLVVTPQDDLGKVKWFGSGFLLNHNGRLYVVTADHVVHPDDFDEGVRTGIDYVPQIVTNNNDKEHFKSIFLPLGGFYNWTGYNFKELADAGNEERLREVLVKTLDGKIDLNDESIPIDVRIPNMLDFAVCEFKNPHNVPLLTNLVVGSDKEVLVQDGTPKVCIDSRYVGSFSVDDEYMVCGTVDNDIKRDMVFERRNVIHGALRYVGLNSDGYAMLTTPEGRVDKDWEGLSGAPVLSANGQLAGMLINGPDDDSRVTAVPIDRILRSFSLIPQTSLCD